MSSLSVSVQQAQLDTILQTILQAALNGEDLTIAQGVFLLEQTDQAAIAQIQKAADQLRQQLVGDTVTYVVNRNINFTNICEQHCSFCAFRRNPGDEGAYWLDWATIREKTAEAVSIGATEICMQGGLNPEAKIDGSCLNYYLKLIHSIKADFPQLHLHAFSPQEVEFIARQDQLTFAQVISALKGAGLGSMPGTAAEVLDDDLRKILCPEKISAATWLEIVATAHRLGLPTTSTLMAGHIETPRQQIAHLAKLRQLQQTAVAQGYPAQISEFIILSFVGEHAPKPLRRRVGRDQPILKDALLLTAVSRLFLGKWIKNHQPSWVKLGLQGATEALRWGCNDIGGTLMEEHITSMAGAKGGTYQTAEDLRRAIQSSQRPAAQRDTLYRNLSPDTSNKPDRSDCPDSKPSWKIKLLYDGDCPLCVREVNFLTQKDAGRGLVVFVDVAAADYSPVENGGIDFETAMGRIHAVLPDGSTVKNVEVFRRIYETLGMGWVYEATKWPVIGPIVDATYGLWADLRLKLTGRGDLATVVAQREQRLAQREACGESGRCQVDG